MFGFTYVPNFLNWTLGEVEHYFKKNRVGESIASPIREAFRLGTPDRGSRMTDLDAKVRLRDANDAFRQAKNAEILELLYLSDRVKGQVAIVRRAMANFSVALDNPKDEKVVGWRDAMEQAVDTLYRMMRSELSEHDDAGGSSAGAAVDSVNDSDKRG